MLLPEAALGPLRLERYILQGMSAYVLGMNCDVHCLLMEQGPIFPVWALLTRAVHRLSCNECISEIWSAAVLQVILQTHWRSQERGLKCQAMVMDRLV